MRRKTTDGKDVVLWSDGAITGTMGLNMLRYPARSLNTVARRVIRGRLALESVWLYSWAEFAEMIKTGTL